MGSGFELRLLHAGGTCAFRGWIAAPAVLWGGQGRLRYPPNRGGMRVAQVGTPFPRGSSEYAVEVAAA